MAENGDAPTNDDARHAASKRRAGKRDRMQEYIDARKRTRPLNELYRLLDLAEGYQRRMQQARERTRRVGLGAIWLANVGFFVGAYLFDSAVQQGVSAPMRGLVVFLFAAALLSTAYYFFHYWQREKNEAKLNGRAVHAIVEMIREVEPFKRIHLSTLEKAEVKVRLSQFEIGPSNEARAENRFVKYIFRINPSSAGATVSAPLSISQLPPDSKG